MTLALDDSHDLYAGARAGVATVSGIDAAVQSVRTRLRTFLGEWFLDTTQGVPYFEEFFVDRPDVRRLERAIRDQVLAVSGITGIVDLSFDIDPTTRRLTISLQAEGEFEGLIQISEVVA